MDANLSIILVAAIGCGLYMAWAIGANDVANSMGTSVGAGAVTVGGAILIAGVFEFLGAFLAGGEVTSTIRKGIIDAESLQHDPDLLVVGMLSALLAAASWLTIASRFGWPVSTTHSIVGAIIGFAVVALGFEAVHWWDVTTIAASWVVTPLVAGAIAYLLVLSVQRLIFDKDDPEMYARRYVPVYIFAAVLMTSIVTFVKGLKHVGLDLSTPTAVLYSVLLAGAVALAGRVAINRVSFGSVGSPAGGHSRHTNVERVFGVLMIVTASGMAFAHGSNDVANAIGPVAAIVGVITSGEVALESTVPTWVLLLGALGIVTGLATFGYGGPLAPGYRFRGCSSVPVPLCAWGRSRGRGWWSLLRPGVPEPVGVPPFAFALPPCLSSPSPCSRARPGTDASSTPRVAGRLLPPTAPAVPALGFNPRPLRGGGCCAWCSTPTSIQRRCFNPRPRIGRLSQILDRLRPAGGRSESHPSVPGFVLTSSST